MLDTIILRSASCKLPGVKDHVGSRLFLSESSLGSLTCCFDKGMERGL